MSEAWWFVGAMVLAACNSTVATGSGGGSPGSDTTSSGTSTLPSSWDCAGATCHPGQVCARTDDAAGGPSYYNCLDIDAACLAAPTASCLGKVCASDSLDDSSCRCDATGCYVTCIDP
jgi:hypothetical protein